MRKETITGAGLPSVTTAVVAVCSGEGLVELFAQLGVQGVVTGGQTMNPSTAELLDTVEHVNAHQVVILPNNKNIIPVAEQIDALTSKHVVVVPTRSMPEALAALVVYDPVAETCWFPLLVRAALQSSGVKVHTICSDISADAINIARRDFGANSAVGVNSSTFMVGDLFEPLKRAQEEASSSEEEELLRPHVVYYLPPQASNQGELRPTSFATAWMCPRTLLWHSVHLC